MRDKRRQVLLGHLRRNKAFKMLSDVYMGRKNGKTLVNLHYTVNLARLAAQSVGKR